MPDYVSDCPISRPIKLKDVTPEVDMNGVMWSDQWGLVYCPQEDVVPLRLPTAPR